MGHAESAQGALELALSLTVIVAGAGPQEAQTVGGNNRGQALGLEGLPEMREVVPPRVGFKRGGGASPQLLLVSEPKHRMLPPR